MAPPESVTQSKYREQGYHLAKGLLSTKEIHNVYRRMITIFQIYTGDQNTEENQLISDLFKEDFEGFVGCANVCQNIVELYKLAVNSKLMDLLSDLHFGAVSINTRPLVSFSSPHTAKNENYWKVPAHQDWPSTQGSLNAVTCWIPLVDVPRKLGPLELVPGSHLQGPLEHIDDGVPLLTQDAFEFISVPMEKGDVLVFSNFLIHRSGVNQTNKIRLSTHCRYDDPTESTFIERKYPRHRIDRRKEGILFPDFPTKKQLHDTFFNDH